MAWAEFSIALLVFFLSHAVPVRPPLRPHIVRLLGPRGFTLTYSFLSLAVLTWLFDAANRAPYVPLWDWQMWHNHVALAAMLPACLILSLSVAAPNPFSFGGANSAAFDSEKPGFVRWVRHPLLLALALWAGVHALTNGDLAHVLLFGVFAVFSVVGGLLVDRRKQREMGSQWHVLRAAIAAQPARLSSPAPKTVVRLGAGVLLYGTLILVHSDLFGVSPWP